MKLPFGIAPGVGMTAGGRRLAVGLLHWGCGWAGDEGLGLGCLVPSAASVIFSGRSEVEPHPAIATAAATAANRCGERRITGIRLLSAEARRRPGARQQPQAQESRSPTPRAPTWHPRLVIRNGPARRRSAL